jgi:hypothetical protein
MQNKLEAEALYNEMQRVGRHGGDGLMEIATNLYNATTAKDATDILIGGWHVNEEFHGGYENSRGGREVLGKGIPSTVILFPAKELIIHIHQPLNQ